VVRDAQHEREQAVASLAARRPALLWRRQVADTETPVAAALKLIEPGRGDFLLESVEGATTRGRHSLIGLAPDLVFRAEGDAAEINRAWATDRAAFAPVGGTLPALRRLVAECRADVPAGLPRALACLVGYFGYETVRPIAGTRPRGLTEAEDDANRLSLLADPKERAEHLMLLDLGRNDAGRAARPGSVRVTDSYTVELYSHVMHIVSNVTAELAPDRDALDALFAGFPAGTVSGAPKVRACEIIAELEPEKRGAYAGGVGYFSPDGSMDSCIVLRTAVVKDGTIHVQAGAGIVADSDPAYEQRECEAKAGAMLAAARDAVARAGEAGWGQ
jgi:anthranilate/para-aminobenzoate synthase component I